MRTENGRKLLTPEEIVKKRGEEIAQIELEREHMERIAKHVYLSRNKYAAEEDLVGPIMQTLKFVNQKNEKFSFAIFTMISKEDVRAFKADRFFLFA